MRKAPVHLNKPTEKQPLIAKIPLLISSAHGIWQNWGLNIFSLLHRGGTADCRNQMTSPVPHEQQVQELRFMTFKPVQGISGKYLQGSDFVIVKPRFGMPLHL